MAYLIGQFLGLLVPVFTITVPFWKKKWQILACAIAVNEALGLGFRITWNVRNLPRFMEWKSTASGDYVIGLEPANSSVYGRLWHEERDSVHRLAPFASETNEIVFTVLDGRAEIDAALAAFEAQFK